MNKNQKKIIAVIYKNKDIGISAEDIAKQASISKEAAWIELAELERINAIFLDRGSLYKPSEGKLKMFS